MDDVSVHLGRDISKWEGDSQGEWTLAWLNEPAQEA